MGVIYVARDFFEGLPYQVAYSAQFGDAALVGAGAHRRDNTAARGPSALVGE